MDVAKQTLTALQKKVLLINTIYHSLSVYKQFKALNLCLKFKFQILSI